MYMDSRLSTKVNIMTFKMLGIRVMVFDATFNNISVIIVAVNFIGGENHRPATSH